LRLSQHALNPVTRQPDAAPARESMAVVFNGARIVQLGPTETVRRRSEGEKASDYRVLSVALFIGSIFRDPGSCSAGSLVAAASGHG
jgi:hypothetical protein